MLSGRQADGGLVVRCGSAPDLDIWIAILVRGTVSCEARHRGTRTGGCCLGVGSISSAIYLDRLQFRDEVALTGDCSGLAYVVSHMGVPGTPRQRLAFAYCRLSIERCHCCQDVR